MSTIPTMSKLTVGGSTFEIEDKTARSKIEKILNGESSLNLVQSWDDLKDKPTIPTKTSQLVNDSNYLTQDTLEELTDIPTFDLTVMGLPAVPLDGTEVSIELDTTTIRESLENGLVRLKLKLEIFANSTTDVEGISSGTYLSFYDSYSCRLLTNKNEHYEIRIIVSTVGITADLILLDTSGTSGTTEIDEDELREMLEEVLV